MLELFLLGYFVPKVKSKGAIIGAVFYVFVIGWMSLTPILFTEGKLADYASLFHNYLSIVFGTVALFIVGFLVGSLFVKAQQSD